MFYFGLESDHFTQMLTQFDFGDSEPRFDEKLFGANPRFGVIQAETIKCGSKHLLIEKHTGSWCFLESKECDIFRSLDKKCLSDILITLPHSHKTDLPEFVARLYSRGLLEIDGRRFIEPDVFNNGPIFYSGGLFVIVPTERCNLACRYCSAKSSPLRQERMNWNVAKRAMDLIIGYVENRGIVEFAGGEAFLEIDLIERIVRYGRKAAEKAGVELKFGAQSNGTLLVRDLLQRIDDLGLSVNISLDGDKISNDMTRVFPGNRGTHEAIARTLTSMHEMGTTPAAICVISKANYQRLETILADYVKLGMDSIKLNPVSRHGRAVTEWDALALEPEEFLKVHVKYLDMALHEGCSVINENTAMMFKILGSKIHPYRCMRSQCGTGRDFMTFAPNGDVYPCPQTRVNSDFRLANVFEIDRLEGIWRGNAIISKLGERQVGKIPDCKECRFKRFCEAGCPISSYEHFGTTDAAHPWCNYYKRIYLELFQRLGEGSRLIDIFWPEAKIYDKRFFDDNGYDN